jgi:GTPase Era involved in 16S rRNA processing
MTLNINHNSNRNKLSSEIRTILADPTLQKDAVLTNGLNAILDDFNSNEYRITVLGEFSSGKSTFLNAMIGRDILPHGVEETTATVTYIHNVPKDDPKIDKVYIDFRDENIKTEILDLSTSSSALIDYVTAKSKTKDVVKEIAEAHIYLSFMESDDPVVLIDTPGLNGIKEGMRDITFREINRSHANICLFHIKGASESDLEVIREFYSTGTPFFFVINQIDRLNEENPEERINEFALDIKEKVLQVDETPEHIYGVSALKALAARDMNIDRLYANDKESLTPEKRESLLKSSRMEIFEDALYNFVKTGEIENNFISNIFNRLVSLLSLTRDEAGREMELLQAKVEDIPEKIVLEKQKKDILDKFGKNLSIIKNKLGVRMDEIYKEGAKKAEETCNDLSDASMRIVASWVTLDKAEKESKDSRVINFINTQIGPRRERIANWLSPRLDVIYREMVDIVKGFVPSVAFSKKDSRWHVRFDNEIAIDDSKLKRIERELIQNRNEKNQLNNACELNKRELSELKRKVQENERDMRRIETQKQSELTHLGIRPTYRTWTKTRYKEKYFLGFIPYDSTEDYTVDNSDQIKEWNKEDERIRSKYDSQAAALRVVKANLERQMRSIDNIAQTQASMNKLDQNISALEREKRRELEEIELQRKYAKEKLRKKICDQAIQLINSSITPRNGELYLALRDDIRKNIDSTQEVMSKDLENLYASLRDKFLKDLQHLINKIEQKANISSIKDRLQDLNEIRECADSYVKKLNRNDTI